MYNKVKFSSFRVKTNTLYVNIKYLKRNDKNIFLNIQGNIEL